MTKPDTPSIRWIIASVCTWGIMLDYLANITLPFAVGLLIKPEAAEFGWGRATLSSGVMVALVVGALLAPFSGRLIDRLGCREVVIPGGILFGLATMALALTNGALWQLYFLFFFVGLFHPFAGYAAFLKLPSLWFKKNRGMALGVTSGIGTGIGAGISPWVIGSIIEHFGWRGSYVVFGLIIIFLRVPACFFAREPRTDPPLRQQKKAAAIGVPISITGSTALEALRTRAFWTLVVLLFFAGIATGGFLVHLFPFLTERGVMPDRAKFLLSILALVTTAGRIITGHFLDRFDNPRVAIMVYASLLVGLLMIDYGPAPLVFAAICVLGFGVGAEGGGITSYFVARYFGMRSFAEMHGYIGAITIAGLGLGPVIVGKLHDMTGSYHVPFLVLDGALAITILGVLTLGPYVYDRKPTKAVIAAEGSPLDPATEAIQPLAGESRAATT
jgi:MFS family permease